MRVGYLAGVALVALFLLGMAPARPQIPDAPTAPLEPIEPYHQAFRTLGASFGAAFLNASVSFSLRGFFGSTVGLCRMSSSGRNRIELSDSAWGRGSNTFREMLVFHELGHCLLGRGHKNTRHSSGRPESLMNSSLFSERTYLANRDLYLKELFTAENRRSVIMASRAETFDDCSFVSETRSVPRWK